MSGLRMENVEECGGQRTKMKKEQKWRRRNKSEEEANYQRREWSSKRKIKEESQGGSVDKRVEMRMILKEQRDKFMCETFYTRRASLPGIGLSEWSKRTAVVRRNHFSPKSIAIRSDNCALAGGVGEGSSGFNHREHSSFVQLVGGFAGRLANCRSTAQWKVRISPGYPTRTGHFEFRKYRRGRPLH